MRCAEPDLLTGYLNALGLDVDYVRASGNSLYRADSAEPVLDLVGGYGATVLGHNHPELVAFAKELLDRQVPVFTQFAGNRAAADVTARLNTILRRELADPEPFAAVFSSSGAEAVEAAVKHAELVRQGHVSAILSRIEENLTALPPAEAATIRRANAERAATRPVLLALEGAFHGKLLGSAQLTHNPDFRLPFAGVGPRCRFVEPTAEAVAQALAAERVTVTDVVDGARVERDLPVVTGFLVEPVQGEGGVRVVGAEAANACTGAGVPVLVDEIQSGMGRTGTFLASAPQGVRGDYYLLAKSLGGGLAKAAVTLIRESHFRSDFSLTHSSTFAADGFSTALAAKVLDLLEADDGALYRQVAERGARLGEALDRVRADHPDQVAEVRGRGLMLGVEFTSTAPRFGYHAAGYLLREHAVRVLPTASAPTTLRVQPSVLLTDEEIARADHALRALCAVLRTSPTGVPA